VADWIVLGCAAAAAVLSTHMLLGRYRATRDPAGTATAPEPLSARLVRAVVEELREGDPVVRIEVGGTAVHLGWDAP
jgi:hypothetical protein